MARKVRDQHPTSRRIGRRGTGKLDATRPAPTPPKRQRRMDARPPDEVQARLLAERQAAIDELARLGRSPERDESGTGESPFEEGDVAQANERTDMSLMHRERLAQRINQLTHALERLARGEYGICEECGRPIEPARLAAVPEVTLCRECQERIEGGHRAA